MKSLLRSAAWTLVAATTVALLAALPAAAGALKAPSGARPIVFASNRGGNSDLHLINSNGAGRRRLTSGPAFDLTPAWSPDDKRVAFTSTRQTGTVALQDIFVVDADGTDLRALVETKRNEEAPSWSPDGRSIVFSRDSGRGAHDLYVVSVATGRVRRLTANSALESVPAWSPNGTANSALESVPAWSPNGRWIAYSRNGEIWLIRPNGRGAHGLGRLGAGVDWAPDWSPDSRLLAFESTSRTSYVNPVGQIWVMRADGTGKRRLTPYSRRHPVSAISPSWAPGGAQIVFTRALRQVWTMRPDGSHLRQLTRPPGEAFTPDW